MIYPSAAFDPLETLRAAAQKATGMYGVPTMFIAMLDHPERQSLNLSHLRTGIMAGSTCLIEVMKRVIDDLHLKEVQIAYGMTETSPVSTQTGPDNDIEHRVTRVGPLSRIWKARSSMSKTGSLLAVSSASCVPEATA